MSLLDYMSKDSQVQIAFLVAFCVCLIGYLINRRMQRAQDYQQEENKEQRRERFMAIGNKPATVVDHEAE